MRRILVGLGSLIMVLALVIGIPAALIAVAGNPFPMSLEDLDAFTRPDYDGRLMMGTILPIIGWIAWAVFALPFLWAIPDAIRDARHGISNRETRGAFGFQRRTAGILIGAILMMGAGTTAAIAAPAAPAMAAPQAVAQQTVAETPAPAPQAAPETAAPAATQLEHQTIVEGDTLWDVAEDKLGDGTRYPEIYAVSTGIVQPDGAQLTNPDLIQPGWNVAIPGTAVAAPTTAPASVPTTPAPEPAPADSAAGAEADIPVAPAEQPGGGAGATGGGSAAETPEVAPVEEEPADTGLGFSTAAPNAGDASAVEEPTVEVAAEAVIDDTDDDEFAIQVMTGGGIAGLLAAGLLGALGVRRALQRRKRRFAERIAMPVQELSDLELELRTVETPHVMDDVDQALRFLAAWAAESGLKLPELYAVRLAPDVISLFLDGPTELPAPFAQASEDGQAWTLAAGALSGIEPIEFASPYPALVTIGRDPGDGLILIDLEYWGAVNVIGDPELTNAALTALALELGTTQWADELQVTLVGVAPELEAALHARHVRHLESTDELLVYLRAQVADTRAALDETQHHTPAEARRAGSDEAWLPEIVILGHEIGEDVRMELAEIVTSRPRLGVAAVAAGTIGEGATITIDSAEHATLMPAGVEFAPQMVGTSDLQRVVGLFATTEEPATRTEYAPADTFAQIVEAAHPVEVDEPSSAYQPIEEPLATTDAAHPTSDIEPAATESESVPTVEEEVSAPVTQTADEAIGEPEPVEVVERVFVRLLGSVDITVPGFDPDTDKAPAGRARELVTFLTLHPNATSEAFAKAFWPLKPPGKQLTESMKKLTSQTRSWLGVAHDGELNYPRHTPALGHRLHPVIATDWDQFQELVGNDPTLTKTEHLVEALRLVRGQPFTGVSERYWAWSDVDKDTIVAAIADAADELFRRANAAQDHIRAQYAATLGHAVAPESEIAWRNLLNAALNRKDGEEFEKIIARHYAFLDGFEEGYEPEPETQALIDHGRRQLPHA